MLSANSLREEPTTCLTHSLTHHSLTPHTCLLAEGSGRCSCWLPSTLQQLSPLKCCTITGLPLKAFQVTLNLGMPAPIGGSVY